MGEIKALGYLLEKSTISKFQPNFTPSQPALKLHDKIYFFIKYYNFTDAALVRKKILDKRIRVFRVGIEGFGNNLLEVQLSTLM